VYLRNKWAFLSFELDDVGTTKELPKGAGCGLSYGTIGRVGGVMQCEYAGTFDAIEDVPIATGANAGQIAVQNNVLKLSGTRSCDGSFDEVSGRDSLPKQLKIYTDKLVDLDSAFTRVKFPY
jgi:hypothetical protein